MLVSPAASRGAYSVLSAAILGRGDDPGSLARVAQADLYGDKAVRAKAGADGEGDAGKAELQMGELQPLAAAGDLPPGGTPGGRSWAPKACRASAVGWTVTGARTWNTGDLLSMTRPSPQEDPADLDWDWSGSGCQNDLSVTGRDTRQLRQIRP